jgi:hypothetical protein
LADPRAGLEAEGEEVATEEEWGGCGDFEVEIFDTRAKPGEGAGRSEDGRLDAREEPRFDREGETAELAVGDRPSALRSLCPAPG